MAELKARQKNADHPVFDPDTRRRMPSFNFRAIIFERHGYLAEETVGIIKQLAYCRALALGLEPSAEIRRWYGVISCCIQRANAKILRCGLRTNAMSELQRLFVPSSLLVAPAVLDATGTRLAPAADDADDTAFENDLFCPVEHSLRSCIENFQLARISSPTAEEEPLRSCRKCRIEL